LEEGGLAPVASFQCLSVATLSTNCDYNWAKLENFYNFWRSPYLMDRVAEKDYSLGGWVVQQKNKYKNTLRIKKLQIAA